MLDVTGRLGANDGNYVFTFDCGHATPENENFRYFEFFHKMSPNLTFMGCPLKPRFTNVCFHHGVFGAIRKLERDRLQFTK